MRKSTFQTQTETTGAYVLTVVFVIGMLANAGYVAAPASHAELARALFLVGALAALNYWAAGHVPFTWTAGIAAAIVCAIGASLWYLDTVILGAPARLAGPALALCTLPLAALATHRFVTLPRRFG